MTTEGFWLPTMSLRNRIEWLSDERTGLVLQQMWTRTTNEEDFTQTEVQWRDVPTDEKA